MIVTELYVGQGLGNQLWVYAACRAIARRLGVRHQILGAGVFKGAQFLTLDYGEVAQEHRESSRPLRVFNERVYYDHELDYVSSSFDASVLRITEPTRLEGLFQSESYLFSDAQRLHECVAIEKEYLRRRYVQDDCCVLNIRGGEYKRHRKFMLPRQYWLNGMRNMREIHGVRRFLVVTDDPRYARSLLPSVPVLEGGIAECYLALHQARYLVVSNSTFSYFPVTTSSGKVAVIGPRLWARHGNRERRWASPANLYRGWLWQDVDGSLASYEACVEERDATTALYEQEYTYSVARAAFAPRSLRSYIPEPIRRAAKRALGVVAPRYFG